MFRILTAWNPTLRVWIEDDGKIPYAYKLDEPIRVTPQEAVEMYEATCPGHSPILRADIIKRTDYDEPQANGKSYSWEDIERLR